MNRIIVIGLLAVAALVALLWSPIQISRAISRCVDDASQCEASADTLCAAGAAGASALADEAPEPGDAAEPLRDLVFFHAACDAQTDRAGRLDRVVATLTGEAPEVTARRARLDALGPALSFAVFARLAAQGVHLPRIPAAPGAEAPAALKAAWCEAVVAHLAPRLAQAPAEGSPPGLGAHEVFERLTAIDCGPATDAALAAAVQIIQAPRIAREAALAEAHGGYGHQADLARKRGDLERLGDGLQTGALQLKVAQRAQASAKPWRWLRPLFTEPMCCADRGMAVFQLGEYLRLEGWTPADHAALVAAISPFLTRCSQEHASTPFEPVFEALPAHREAMLRSMAAGRPHCDWVHGLTRTLRRLPRGTPADPRTTAAIAAFEADARARCPGTVPTP